MKVSRVLVLFAATVLPQLAGAEVPKAQLDTKTLSMVQAAYKFCAKVDSKDAAFFRARLHNLDAMLSAQQLNNLRKSRDYERALDSAEESLEKVARPLAIETCAAVANEK